MATSNKSDNYPQQVATQYRPDSNISNNGGNLTRNIAANLGEDKRGKPTYARLDEGGNEKYNFSDSVAEPITKATKGHLIAPFRKALGVIKLVNPDPYGKVLAVIPLSRETFTELGDQFDRFVNWRINDLQIDLTNVAPLASASGSVQVFYINDPSNSYKIGEDASKVMMRQADSRNVKAKDTLTMHFNTAELGVPGQPSDSFKMCVNQGVDVFNRYGSIVIAVRASPTIGEGAVFTVTFSGSIGFYGMTHNSGNVMKYQFQTINTGAFSILKAQPENPADTTFIFFTKMPLLQEGEEGSCTFLDHIVLQVDFVDASDNHFTLPVNMRQMQIAGREDGTDFFITINNIFTMDADYPFKKINILGGGSNASAYITTIRRGNTHMNRDDKLLSLVNSMIDKKIKDAAAAADTRSLLRNHHSTK